MNKLITIITLLALSSCVENKFILDDIDKELKGADGSSCTTKQMSNGALILCTDGSSSVVSNGTNGSNGQSCSSQQVESGVQILCGTQEPVLVSNGALGAAGATGATGSNGSNGMNGLDGQNGTNGTNGTNGLNASGVYITEIINPCGAEFSNEEIFLRLSNNVILALYDGGPNLDRLALLVPGNYVTTDSNGHSCSFTLNSSMQLENQVRH